MEKDMGEREGKKVERRGERRAGKEREVDEED